MVELQVFCAPAEDRRPKLQTPFSAGAHTYATDGRICIRVARREDVPERSDAPDVSRFFAEPPIDGLVPLPAIDLPKPAQTRCDECDGTGTEHDCPDCSCECVECDGLGHTSQRVVVRFGKHLLDSHVWRRLAYLPNARLSEEPDEHKRIRFVFDGGGAGVTISVRHHEEDLVVETPTLAETPV